MSSLLPLLPDAPLDTPVAYRSGGVVTRRHFLNDVERVAGLLQIEGDTAINLCLDRYWFTVAFMACIQRKVVTLLPGSAAPQHLAALCERHPGTVAIGDQADALMQGCPWVRIDHSAEHPARQPQTRPLAAPPVPADQVVARFYTSGSTGEPKACNKTFGGLRASHAAAIQRLQALTGRARSPVVGTSSFRHMFGFEATITLPLWGGGGLSPDTPFFPADVAAALAALPEPGLLVTTPYHLRKMLEADIVYPACAGLLSATAPLSAGLAADAEARFGAPLVEIYGSTELGMMASRRTALDEPWHLLDGFELKADGQGHVAHSASLDSPQALHDVIEPLDARRFRLIDRSSNLLNIAGKRSSLGFLNQVLQSLPGVQDGVFCVPAGAAEHDAGRLAAFVVAPGMTAAEITAGLRAHVDPAFLPRPIVLLPALPRDANAKLPASALASLMDTHLTPKAG